MTSKNKYYRRSKISEAKFRQLLRLFAMDLTATDTAQLCHLSVRSVNAIYQRIRVRFGSKNVPPSLRSQARSKPMNRTSAPSASGANADVARAAYGRLAPDPKQVARAENCYYDILRKAGRLGRTRLLFKRIFSRGKVSLNIP